MASLAELHEDMIAKRAPPGGSRNLWTATVCSCLGMLCVGYTIGYSSPVIPQLRHEKLLTDAQASWFGSLITVGALIGGLSGGMFVGRYGRRLTIVYSSVPFAVGWMVLLSSNQIAWLYAGRLLTGLAMGMVMVPVPVYVAETSTKESRGMLGSGPQLFITIGILSVYVLGMGLQWQAMAGIGVALSCLYGASMYTMPETPRYLLMKSQRAEALKSLTFLRGTTLGIDEECRDIQESFDPSESFSWAEFLKPELRQPLKVSLLLMVLQQLSGINVVMFYTVSIFEDAGYTESSRSASAIIGGVQVAVTLMASILMDRVGRRPLLLISSISMSIAMGLLGWYYHSNQGAAGSSNLSWIALLSLVIFIVGFSLGWGPIPMLMTSEIFPSQARGSASSAATCISWLCAFLITKEFSSMQLLLGKAGAFWFFQACLLASVVFIWKSVPETKGKSLEDIELYFMGRVLHNVRGI